MAISSAVDTISINNNEVLYLNGSKVPKETLASGFAEIFSLVTKKTNNVRS